MVVKFKNLLMGYTGMVDDSVIYFSPKLGKYIIRRAPQSKDHESKRRFAQIQKQIFALKPSDAYKQDIRDYLLKYNALPSNKDRHIFTWNFLYSKMMWNMHHILKIDLTCITREQIAELPCRNIASAIDAGLLPKVKGYMNYTAEM